MHTGGLDDVLIEVFEMEKDFYKSSRPLYRGPFLVFQQPDYHGASLRLRYLLVSVLFFVQNQDMLPKMVLRFF